MVFSWRCKRVHGAFIQVYALSWGLHGVSHGGVCAFNVFWCCFHGGVCACVALARTPMVLSWRRMLIQGLSRGFVFKEVCPLPWGFHADFMEACALSWHVLGAFMVLS